MLFTSKHSKNNARKKNFVKSVSLFYLTLYQPIITRLPHFFFYFFMGNENHIQEFKNFFISKPVEFYSKGYCLLFNMVVQKCDQIVTDMKNYEAIKQLNVCRNSFKCVEKV